jgi:hypothetical protein
VSNGSGSTAKSTVEDDSLSTIGKMHVKQLCWETSQRYHRAPNLSYRQDSLSLTQAAPTPREYSRSTVTTDKCCYQYPLLWFTLLLKQIQNMRSILSRQTQCTHVLSASIRYQPPVRYQPSVNFNQSYHDWVNQSCHDWMWEIALIAPAICHKSPTSCRSVCGRKNFLCRKFTRKR